MDILCEMMGDPNVRDGQGHVTFAVGGTGYNVAINLAQMGIRTRIVTALPPTGMSRVIEQSVGRVGKKLPIETMVEYHDALQQGGFCAFLKGGDIWKSVTGSSVDTHVFGEEFIRRALNRTPLCVIDANVSPDSVARIADIAHEMRCPIVFHTVSDAKASRLLAARHVGWVFTNRRELAIIMRDVDGTSYDMTDIAATMDAAKRLSAKVSGGIIVGMDCDGVAFCKNGGHPIIIAVETIPDAKTFIGAGDALMAGTLAGIIEGVALIDAVTNGIRIARRVIGNTHAALGPEALETTLDELHRTATYDALTGALSLQSGMNTLARVIDVCSREHTPVSIMFCDANRFKYINDTFGHAVGDRVLRDIVSHLKRSLRETHDFVVRVGGDEFVCFMPGVGEAEATKIASRLGAETFVVLPDGEPARVSVGAATWNGAETADELLARGDAAMYDMKHKNGQSSTVISDEPSINDVNTW